jgi:carboxymethylenebutenolidase
VGEMIRLAGPDGFEFTAYHARPTDARRGGLVLIQEIFGVTEGIKALADGFAADGYEVIAPSMYDRLEPGFVAAHDEAGKAAGLAHSLATGWDQVAGDLQACVNALKAPVFVTGYCWGGTAAWVAACRCTGVSAASCFYGRRIGELADERPSVPTILHFGKRDASIPLDKVEAIGVAHPDLPIYLYDAGHGFAGDHAADDEADAARLARLRTQALFMRSGGGRGEV